MKAIRTLIIDDEPVARQGLRKLLGRETDVQLCGECADGSSAVQAIEQFEPELVFVDVQMPGMNGFEILMRARVKRPPLVIFVTAYNLYALRAFEVDALDYLLKPFSDRRFRQALEKARTQIWKERHLSRLNDRVWSLLDRLDAKVEAAASPAPTYLTRIPVRIKEKVTLVDVGTIDWIEAANNYVVLHVGERSCLVRATISSLEKKLDPERFLRVHRSRILNIDRVREMQPLASGDCMLMLQNGTELTSSRTYSERLRRALNPVL